jgi:hypothetical protein
MNIMFSEAGRQDVQGLIAKLTEESNLVSFVLLLFCIGGSCLKHGALTGDSSSHGTLGVVLMAIPSGWLLFSFACQT